MGSFWWPVATRAWSDHYLWGFSPESVRLTEATRDARSGWMRQRSSEPTMETVLTSRVDVVDRLPGKEASETSLHLVIAFAKALA
jgi:hypothetical protein